MDKLSSDTIKKLFREGRHVGMSSHWTPTGWETHSYTWTKDYTINTISKGGVCTTYDSRVFNLPGVVDTNFEFRCEQVDVTTLHCATTFPKSSSACIRTKLES